MDFDTLALQLATEGLAPPPADASEAQFGDWIDRMMDTAAMSRPVLEAQDR